MKKLLAMTVVAVGLGLLGATQTAEAGDGRRSAYLISPRPYHYRYHSYYDPYHHYRHGFYDGFRHHAGYGHYGRYGHYEHVGHHGYGGVHLGGHGWGVGIHF